VLNIILAYLLSRPTAYGLEGLAIAQSFVATIEVVILFAIMLYRDPGLLNLNFWKAIFKIISVAGFSLVAGFIMISIYPLGINDQGLALFTKLSLISAVILSTHVAVSSLFGLEEVRPIFKRAKKIIFKSIGQPY
ncbi:MAG TPA: hypothetical protein VK983_02500, partial [Candidatus Limnocylindrales bacterium]|nr:hypothetical protein [Candidatus Limnocylindrales bacterium]